MHIEEIQSIQNLKYFFTHFTLVVRKFLGPLEKGYSLSFSLHRCNIPDVESEASAKENVENDKGGVGHVGGDGQIAADNNTIRLEQIN